MNLPNTVSLRGLFCAVVLCITSFTVLAQDDPDMDALPESHEKVQIEVIVFRFVGKGLGAEMSAKQSPASSQGQILVESGSGDYAVISPSNRSLSGAHSRLQASSDLKPLYFTAWQQNLSDQRWVAISAAGSDGERLSGRFLLNNGRPLGLKLELQLDGVNLPSKSDARFRLKSSRPAYFEETLYFDHPALGALVRVEQRSDVQAVN